MGCDIHAHLEVKDINGNWHNADPVVLNLADTDKDYYFSDFPFNRDYNLFSILLKDHVRNDSNIKNSIAPSRGIPKDSPYYEELTDDDDLWGQSYVTASEVIKFADKHPTIENSGYVSKEECEALQAGKITVPSMSWQGGDNDNTQYFAKWHMVSPIVYLSGYLVYILHCYRLQVFDLAYWKQVDPDVQEKARKWLDSENDNLRIVFAFDN